MHERVFYFTNGDKVYVSDGGEYEEIIGDGDERSFMEKQLCEFVKLLRGEKNEMASAEYGRKIICALEQLYDSKEIYR